MCLWGLAGRRLRAEAVAAEQPFIFGEVPGGIKNNVNVTFTLTIAPNPALSLVPICSTACIQLQGVDYTLSGLDHHLHQATRPGMTWHVAALYSH